MNYLIYFIQIILIQYTSAQVISLGGRNFLNNQNCANNANIATNYANNGVLSNYGQTGYEVNNVVATPSNMQQDYINANLLNANGNIANANIGLANGNIGVANGNNGLANANIGLASGNIGVSNIGESAVVYKNVPMYANVVKPPREYGIEFSSGALQMGGNVEVNGRMPFNGNVAINGAVPSQGQGAVNYTCGQLNNEES